MHGLLQKFLSNFTSNDNEAMHSPIGLFSEGNFSQKSISSNMSQLSIESSKSSEPVYDIPLRESGKDSPNKTATEKEGIYYLLWPQPKTICELKNFSPPFVIGKELFISIIQVSKYNEVLINNLDRIDFIICTFLTHRGASPYTEY